MLNITFIVATVSLRLFLFILFLVHLFIIHVSVCDEITTNDFGLVVRVVACHSRIRGSIQAPTCLHLFSKFYCFLSFFPLYKIL